ncbi:MAG: sulfatase-like hydrolase/transferase [Candidatus Hydrogenedens sp.]|nr:sulfatase-like hydrolase/transferase [Candidatus Hydrogenedens sp.]
MRALRYLFLTALAMTCAGCGVGGPAEPPLPNVLLISLDTTRADRLGCYGYERNTSPNIDKLAAQSTRYTRAYTTAPWTLPTHTSIFTGRFPTEHGMRHYKTEDGTVAYPKVPEDLPTLGVMFRELGYDTAAYVTNQAFLNPEFGILRGFEYTRCNWMPGEQIVNLAKRWLARERDRPFMLFMNFMDAHYPYNVTPVEGLLPEPPDQNVDLLGDLTNQVMGTSDPIDEVLRNKVIDQYDTGLANQDRALGRIFDYLRESGQFDNTLIIVTSDHGELFGEFRLVAHDKALYEPLMKAVMLVCEPGQTDGGVSETLLSSVDIPAIILDQLPEALAAPYRERFPYAPGNHPITGEWNSTVEHDLRNPVWGARFNGSANMWIEWPWKLIYAPGDLYELYHLEEDPGELQNRYEDEQERAHTMAAAMKAWREPRLRDLSDVAMPSLSPEDRDAMQALGYL